MNNVVERNPVDFLQYAKTMLETSTLKSNPKNKNLYLKKSTQAVLSFLEERSHTKSWGSAVVLSNTARSILTGLEDGVDIPAEDVLELESLISSFEDIYNEHLQLVNDELQEEERLRGSQAVAREKLNETLRVTTPSLGLKALAMVNLSELGMDEVSSTEESSLTERKTLTSSSKVGLGNMEDSDYRKLNSQLNTLDRYLSKTREKLPNDYKERFVILRQPILITGNLRYNPPAAAKKYVAREGIQLDGYWVLKNQLVLGITKSVSKVVKNPQFRKSVEMRLRDIYQADLEKKLKKARNESQRLRLTQQMEADLEADLESELENLARPVNLDALVKAIGKQLGYQVILMDGTSQVRGSPYTYYWLVSSDISENVLHGLYTDVANWVMPYNN